jgi:riboflavin synthase
MFTGIIENTAPILAVTPGPRFTRLVLASELNDVVAGESVAVNGVCLTVAELPPGELHFDVIPETLAKTNLGRLQTHDSVHVERSLRAGDRISGHFVQGHVDGPAVLVDQITDNNETRLRLQVSPDLAKFIAPKGSVTIDGVSLTVASLDKDEFEVALIPTTVQLTHLTRHAVGYPFNFEADMIAKTVVSYLARQDQWADDIRVRMLGERARAHRSPR